MTPDEAVQRAKDKIGRGEKLDEWDVANLCSSVRMTAWQEGRQSAFEDMKKSLGAVSR